MSPSSRLSSLLPCLLPRFFGSKHPDDGGVPLWAMTSGKSVWEGVWEIRLASGKVKIKETDLVLVPAADHELCHPMAPRRRSLGWPAPRREKGGQCPPGTALRRPALHLWAPRAQPAVLSDPQPVLPCQKKQRKKAGAAPSLMSLFAYLSIERSCSAQSPGTPNGRSARAHVASRAPVPRCRCVRGTDRP